MTRPISLADLGLTEEGNDIDRLLMNDNTKSSSSTIDQVLPRFQEKRTHLRRTDPVPTAPVATPKATPVDSTNPAETTTPEPATKVVQELEETPTEEEEKTVESNPIVALCNPTDCNAHGECIDGQCSCNSPWTGPGCDIKGCLNGCSDRGECFNGTCYCYPGSAGQDCSEIACPEDCNNDHGTCSKGNCTCFPSYRGNSCGLLRCPLDCSDHGHCNDDGRCECNADWMGDGEFFFLVFSVTFFMIFLSCESRKTRNKKVTNVLTSPLSLLLFLFTFPPPFPTPLSLCPCSFSFPLPHRMRCHDLPITNFYHLLRSRCLPERNMRVRHVLDGRGLCGATLRLVRARYV